MDKQTLQNILTANKMMRKTIGELRAELSYWKMTYGRLDDIKKRKEGIKILENEVEAR